MKEPIVIKATVSAWLSSAHGPQDLEGRPARVISNVCLFDPRNDSGKASWMASGYVLVGEADVTLRLIEKKEMVDSKVESLRAEKTRVMADAQARITDIEASIQKLLAIEYTP